MDAGRGIGAGGRASAPWASVHGELRLGHAASRTHLSLNCFHYRPVLLLFQPGYSASAEREDASKLTCRLNRLDSAWIGMDQGMERYGGKSHALKGPHTNFKVRPGSCQQRSTIEGATFSFPVIGTTKLTY